MTPEQEKIAEQLINAMKQNKGSINWKDFRNQNTIEGTEMSLVIKALKELEIIENFIGDTTVIRLTEKNGWKFPGFESLRHSEQTIKTLSDEISRYDLLTKRFIYKARLIPYIFSTLSLIGVIISIIISVKALNYKKEQPATESAQPLTQQATNTTTLLPVDTALKTVPK